MSGVDSWQRAPKHSCLQALYTVPCVLRLSFPPRVIADALGGDVDAETYELSYSASEGDVATALEAASRVLGTVEVTKTVTGKF